jgi:hypothetical protein
MGVEDDVKRELDTVIGDEYRPRRRWGATLAKWAAAAVLAVGAAAAIMGLLHIQIMQAQTAPSPPRPVTIQIVPSK